MILSVVHDRDIGEAGGPEGVGRLGLHRGLGGEADVAEPVGAAEAVDAVLPVDLVGAADVLDDLETRADREHLCGVLDVVGELLDVAVEAHSDPVVAAHPLVLDHAGAVLGERALDAGDGSLGLIAFADEEAQPQLALLGSAVEREAGRIGATMLAAVEHVDEGAAGRVGPAAVLEHDSRDPAHGRFRLRGVLLTGRAMITASATVLRPARRRLNSGVLSFRGNCPDSSVLSGFPLVRE